MPGVFCRWERTDQLPVFVSTFVSDAMGLTSVTVSLETWQTLPLWLIIFLFSTTCHEAAHALVAKLGGDNTAYATGQLSLDPLPHIRRSPLGMLVIPIASFILNRGTWMIGWASAPYDPVWAGRYPRRAAWMAAAGPAANLGLALLAGVALKVGLALNLFIAGSGGAEELVTLADTSSNPVTLGLSVLFTLNMLLFTFNLLPVPPLDGSSVIGLVLPLDWVRKWHELFDEPMFSLVGLVVAWQIFPHVWAPVYTSALRLLGL